jgi:Protein of unknown function (DUF3800)
MTLSQYLEVRSLGSLSAWTRPEGNWLMAALKGYFDDSGDPADKRSTQDFFSVAGYLAPVSSWEPFEIRWREVLSEFDIPYLHMKELHFRTGAFVTWTKGDPEVEERIARLLARFVTVIGEIPDMRGFGAVIALKSLERFNAEKSKSLVPKALAIYATALELRKWNQTADMEIILDRTADGHASIATAKKYGRTDEYYPFMKNFPSFLPLSKDGTTGAHNTPALQAADFLAWEVRKNCELKKDVLKDAPRPDDPNAGRIFFGSYLRDRLEHMKRHGLTSISIQMPMQRRSLTELASATPVEGCLWTYHTLCDADVSRGGVWE